MRQAILPFMWNLCLFSIAKVLFLSVTTASGGLILFLSCTQFIGRILDFLLGQKLPGCCLNHLTSPHTERQLSGSQPILAAARLATFYVWQS
jgi:hypothetical protein